jgi:hypothetical protein
MSISHAKSSLTEKGRGSFIGYSLGRCVIQKDMNNLLAALITPG